MIDWIGKSIGGARVEKKIGAGPTGTVYRGRDEKSGDLVAVKIIDPSLALNPELARRFDYILAVAAPVSHENIVRIREFGEQNVEGESTLFIVSDFAVGGSLRELLRKLRPMPLRVCAELARQAAQALAFAHAGNVVHGGIKPENLLIGYPTRGNVSWAPDLLRVSDFGLVRLERGTFGDASWSYMSPEQCDGVNLDGRSDIYSLGIVLYEICTGYPPFQATSFEEICQKHRENEPVPPRQIRPEIPLGLEEIIVQCLQKKPIDRFASTELLVDRLLAAKENAPGQPMLPTPPAMPPPPPVIHPIQMAPPRTGSGGGRNRQDTLPAPGVLPRQNTRLAGGAAAAVDSLAATGEPRLWVMQPNGKSETERRINRPRLTVGRDDDNDIVLSDPLISGHHMRLDWDGSRMMVTDVGSTNGTFLNGRRLKRDTPQEWATEEPLVAAGHLLVWQPPGAMTPPMILSDINSIARVGSVAAAAAASGTKPAQAAAAATAAPPPLEVIVNDPHLKLMPGQPAPAALLLINQSSAPIRCRLKVEGFPLVFLEGLPKDSVTVEPQQSLPVTFQVTVPRSPDCAARTYTVKLTVRTEIKQTSNTAEPFLEVTRGATWTVLPFYGMDFKLDTPRLSSRWGGTYNFRVRNEGNAPLNVALTANDDRNQLTLRFDKTALRIDPGREEKVGLRVLAPKRWLGAPDMQMIHIKARPESLQKTNPFAAGGAAMPATPQDAIEREATVQFSHEAMIPSWAIPVGLVVCALFGLLFMSWMKAERNQINRVIQTAAKKVSLAEGSVKAAEKSLEDLGALAPTSETEEAARNLAKKQSALRAVEQQIAQNNRELSACAKQSAPPPPAPAGGGESGGGGSGGGGVVVMPPATDPCTVPKQMSMTLIQDKAKAQGQVEEAEAALKKAQEKASETDAEAGRLSKAAKRRTEKAALDLSTAEKAVAKADDWSSGLLGTPEHKNKVEDQEERLVELKGRVEALKP